MKRRHPRAPSASRTRLLAALFLTTPTIITAVSAAFAAADNHDANHHHNGTAPRPTHGLTIPELLRRQSSSDAEIELLVASDKTCGYLSGSAGAALTCDDGRTCAFVTDLVPSATPRVGVQMCCGDGECVNYLACANADVATDPDQCNDVCQADSFLLKCDSENPFCQTIVYETSISHYDCAATTQSRIALAQFTYNGWDLPFPLQTATVRGGEVILEGDDNDKPIFSFPLDEPTEVPTVGPSDSSESPPGDDDDGGGGGGSKTGAIVGGTIGGVAALGLIGVGAALLFRRRRSMASTEDPNNTGQGGSVASPDGDGGGGMASPYPMLQHQQQQQQYPQQHQQYAYQQSRMSVGPHSLASVGADSMAYTSPSLMSPGMQQQEQQQKFHAFPQAAQVSPNDPHASLADQQAQQMAYGVQGQQYQPVAQQYQPVAQHDQTWTGQPQPQPQQYQQVYGHNGQEGGGVHELDTRHGNQ